METASHEPSLRSIGLLIAAGLSLCPAIPAGAQSSCNGMPATIVGTTPGVINGTTGDDVIVGTAGADQIFGLGGADVICGDGGDDQINGGQGNDLLDGGLGDDTFVWNPGDGSDVVEGRSGSDTLHFNGANVGEHIDLSANGARLRFSRDVATIAMDVDGTEQVTFNALGGADTITVNSLAGTSVQQVNLNLAGTLNGGAGDSQADTVNVNGTNAGDSITISGSAGSAAVQGLSASINVSAADSALDSLHIATLGGADLASAQNLAAGGVSLALDGGSENDILIGSAGDDLLTGGLGADSFSGGPGTDTVTDFNPTQGDTQDGTIP